MQVTSVQCLVFFFLITEWHSLKEEFETKVMKTLEGENSKKHIISYIIFRAI